MTLNYQDDFFTSRNFLFDLSLGDFLKRLYVVFQSRRASKLLLTTIFELVQNSSFIITFFRTIKSAREACTDSTVSDGTADGTAVLSFL